MSIIELKNINKSYGENENKQKILNNVNLRISKGSMVSIMGPSGSGKTSLLNILGLLDGRYDGEYYIDGELVDNKKDEELAKIRNNKIGFVFQDFHLISELTVIDNVKMQMNFSNIHRKRRDKISKKDMDEKSREVLAKVGLEDHMYKKPGQLSGGQKQRVAIARALVGNPEIILADEPTGALDSKTGMEIMNLLKSLNDMGKTILLLHMIPK